MGRLRPRPGIWYCAAASRPGRGVPAPACSREAGRDVREEPLPMRGPASADDPALEQARLAQLAPRAYADAWLCRYTAGTGALRLAPPAQAAAVHGVIPPVLQLAAQGRADGAGPGAVRMRAEATGAAPADRAVPTADAARAARPKPVPPALARGQRDAALSKARALNSERKEIRDQLQQGRLSLAQALAQDGGGGARDAGRDRSEGAPRHRRGNSRPAAARGGHRCRPPGRGAHRGAAWAARGRRGGSRALSWPLLMATASRFRPVFVTFLDQRGGGAVPRAVLAHPAPGQIPSARPSDGPRR